MVEQLEFEAVITPILKDAEKIAEPFKDIASELEGAVGGLAGGVTQVADPRMMALMVVMAGALLVIQKILDAILGVINRAMEALFGPLLKGINMLVDILLVPMNILGTFLLTTIIPFFSIAAKASAALVDFLQIFITRREQALFERLQTPEGLESPLAAELAASAEALSFMFGGLTVLISSGIQQALFETAVFLHNGFVEIIAALADAVFAGAGDIVRGTKVSEEAMEGFRDAMAKGVEFQLDAVSVLATGIGDATFQVGRGMEDWLNNLALTEQDFTAENQNLTQSIGDFTQEVANSQDEYSITTGEMVSAVANTGTAANDMTNSMTELNNTLTGGRGAVQTLKNLAANAETAADRIGMLGIKAAQAIDRIDAAGGRGGGTGALLSFNLLGVSTTNLNLGGAQVT